MNRTVLKMLNEASQKYGGSPYTLDKQDGGYVAKSYNEVKRQARFLASEFVNLGFEKNDKIALLAEGRSNWVIGEYGVLYVGCVCVPLSIKLLPEEILFRLNHSEAKAMFVSRNTFEKVAPVWKKIKQKHFKLIYLDKNIEEFKETARKFGINTDKDVLHFDYLIQKGEKSFKENEEKLRKIEEKIDEDDVVTISYTSGTTGNPKGIMLTHLNYFSNSSDAMEYFNVKHKDRLLIILPLDHSFAHTVGIYASLVRGLSIYFVDARGGGMSALKNIPINMKEANPHFMLTVPALSGNFMNKIKEGIKSKGGFIEKLFNAGMEAGILINKNGYRKAGFLTRLVKGIPYKLANWLIFRKVRKIFGNNLRYCVGGGALLDIKQQQFFYSLGMPIYQGYGLTEATPIISANTPEVHKLGSSGKVLPSVECRIITSDGKKAKTGEKGEIVIRGENVMKGYYKNKEATEKTIKGGWLYTGDMGYYDHDNFLVVVGREKALLISEDGEKYSPEEIEEAIMNSSDFIYQVMVYNDHRKFTTALVTLDIPKLQNHIKKNKIANAEILMKDIMKSFFSFKYEKEYANKFPEKWTPSAFRIVPEPFSEENKMINSTMKMVRFKITETYQDLIEDMYTYEGNKIVNPQNMDVVKQFLPFG